jgi:aspartate carbamoyltransferase regulatory subunit
VKNGIVIDHITPGKAMQLYHMLGIDKLDCCVAVIQNVASRQMGKKDMIKIDASISINLDVIGYVDPGATVNVIRDSALVEKKSMPMPETLTNVIKCKNPRCITSVEQELVHVFKLTDKENKVYRCLYCESKPN